MTYFGNLELYDKEKGDILLKKLKEVLQPGPRLCNYFNFLHCDAIALKCLPMLGSRTVSSRTSTNPNEPHVKIMIELEVEKPCDLDTPLIFKDRVVFACSKGYACMKTREGKICAPDCNSIYAPLEACPPVPTTLMTEEPELETSTLAPHNVPETTFPTEEIGRNDIDGTMLEGNKEKGSEPDDTDLDESLGSKNQDADESVGSENQDVDESVGSKTQDIDGDLDEAQETAKMYSTDENEVATVDSDPNDDSGEAGRADPETNAPTPAPTTTTTTTTTPTTNTPTTTTSTTDTTITTTKTEAPTSTANPTTKQPTESTPVTTTESTTVTTTETTTESTTQTIRTTRTPEHKRTFGEECRRNDSRAVYPQNDKHLICDSALFLVCLERQCRCLRGLAYAQHLNKCAIPIGERCSPEIWRRILPIYMDSMNLPCQYGVCKKDNVGKICRPESDRGLILVG
ncbi:hypothetical protein Ocin01_05883 [Orchesella cincta]|uniref:Uncharacterized protein n=1 Tax=Orchesella cincta TaxID=48709 RepID=A0A1D2N6T9_ORCCI|nr:hypothetical protein Ocin01_05883 [Orchesella cincta]